MIVLDASAAVSALLSDGTARRTLATEQVHVPHLVDAEIASALRRRAAMHQLDPRAAWRALDIWRRLGLTRHPTYTFLDRIWELRENVSAYDATYVALAEYLDCALLTADTRLSRSAKIRCPVTMIPR